jgi:hypothetical protein
MNPVRPAAKTAIPWVWQQLAPSGGGGVFSWSRSPRHASCFCLQAKHVDEVRDERTIPPGDLALLRGAITRLHSETQPVNPEPPRTYPYVVGLTERRLERPQDSAIGEAANAPTD